MGLTPRYLVEKKKKKKKSPRYHSYASHSRKEMWAGMTPNIYHFLFGAVS